MGRKFTTSINIIRDKGKDYKYIPTPNATRIVNQISNDFKKGGRSYNIIGSYGTGKSSFLWALQETIDNNKKYFKVNLLSQPNCGFINLIGEYKSIREAFADYLQIGKSKNNTENIFSELFNRYHDLGKNNPLLFIFIDEFGKFLEYASQNEPEKEIYFIQQLAEFVNNTDLNILLITTVHQNFDAYSIALNQTQKNEWSKVKGRFKEVTFNEPVEQLLFLASEHQEYYNANNGKEAVMQKTISLLSKSKSFAINENYINQIAQKLYPLDVISAYVVTTCLQRYGQNERSLFSFLESSDYNGIEQHKALGKGFYSIPSIYDYLISHHFSYINSNHNADFGAWKFIKSALEKAEASFDIDIDNYSALIKTIGLLNLCSQAGAILNKEFLVSYSKLVLNIANASKIIEDLEKKKIIFYRNFSNRFIMFEGTDLDFQTAILQAGNSLDEVKDVVTLLNKYYNLPPVVAKKVMYETGTPRLFEYRITDKPISEIPQGEIDGFINLIISEKDISKEIMRHSAEQQEAILYCYYVNAKSIKDSLFEIEKTKKVISENIDDRVAVRELNKILAHHQNLLNHRILDSLYNSKKEVKWYFNGGEIKINSKREFNSKLSSICNTIYCQTPRFNNELVNKHKISSSIHTARKKYFEALTNNWHQPDLGFASDKFPPEKTIYLTLLENNNIKLLGDDLGKEVKPNDKNNFLKLWNASCKFLNSAKSSKRGINDFIDMLSQKPFKLKQGLIDFWIPTFLFIKRDDFALFGEHGYIPTISDEVLDLIVKQPDEFEIKAYSIDGVKLNIFNSYRIFLSQNTKAKLSNNGFIETIKPFLIFYKDLPDYTKNTIRLSKEAKEIRKSISNSKDPEETFFEAFPTALGYTTKQLENSKKELQQFIAKLQNAIKELRNCYDEFVNRFEEFILEDIVGEIMEFESYKQSLQERYTKLRSHLLLPQQKVFYQRLNSQIEDRKAWLSSLAQAILNTPLDKVTDEGEVTLYDKFKSMIVELDSLTNLSKSDFKEDKEDIYDLQMNSFVDGLSKKIIRMPKNKRSEVTQIQDGISKKLSADNTVNIAALANLLKEMLKK